MTNELTTQQGDKYADLMRLAIEKGPAGVEALERIATLKERADAQARESAFHAAMSAAQAEFPEIRKTGLVDTVTKRGAHIKYTFAKLEEIAHTIRPILSKFGLSYRWDSKVDERILSCTCTVTHQDGHSMGATFSCPVEESGQRSVAQDHAATLTYARRQSLIQALGLVTADEDTDAMKKADEPITPAQLSQLEDWLAESGADREKFLKWAGVESLDQMPASMFGNAVAALRKKAGRE